MTTRIFSVLDKKAQIYNSPVCLHNIGVACRAFGELANNPDHAYGKHPGDYEIWELGTYDDSNGKIVPHQEKLHVYDMIDLVADHNRVPV